MRVAVRDSTALAAGSAVSGLLAYVFFAMVTRSLGAEGAAPVSVLWTYWSLAAATLTFPLQHWIVRSVTAHHGEGAVRSVAGRVSLVVLAVAVLGGVVSALLRDRLFHRQDLLFPLLVAVVTVGSAFVGLVRGVLTARLRFVSVAWALVAENGARCLAALVVLLTSLRSSGLFGVALASGQLVGFLWPSALRLSTDGTPPDREDSWVGFLGGSAGGQLVSQVVLTGGPVVLALSGGSPAQVTALFAALALFRAPYTLALGAVAQATGRLTTLAVRGELATLQRVRRVVLLLTVVAVVVAGLLGRYTGPWQVHLVFGPGIDVPAGVAALVAVGCAAALGNLSLTLVLMARNRTTAVVRSWGAAALVGAAVLVVVPESPLAATSWAFVAAELGAFAALLVADARGSRTVGPAEPVAR